MSTKIFPHYKPLEKRTSYGCYPLFYVQMKGVGWSGGAGDVLCPECASAETKHRDLGVFAADVNWEDPELHCDACSRRIKSAYAEPEDS